MFTKKSFNFDAIRCRIKSASSSQSGHALRLVDVVERVVRVHVVVVEEGAVERVLASRVVPVIRLTLETPDHQSN